MIPQPSWFSFGKYKTKIFLKNPITKNQKITIFQPRQFSIFFRENFKNWSLGEWDKLMQNLYDRQAVQHKLKKWVKTQKTHIYPFLSLRQTAWRPYRLSHIYALHINLSYSPKNQSLKFSQKNCLSWKKTFCFGFWLLCFSKKHCFVFSQWKSPWLSYEVAFISALWRVSSESWKKLCPIDNP